MQGVAQKQSRLPAIIGVLVMAGFVACMCAGPGTALRPSNLTWTSWLLCPSGSTMEVESYRSAFSSSNAVQLRVFCVDVEGERSARSPMLALLVLFGMLFALFFVLLPLALALLGRSLAGHQAVSLATQPTGSQQHQIEQLLRQGRKIEAIKRMRTLTGMGLREAKDYVEQLAAGRLPPAAPALGTEPAAGPAAQRLAEIKALLEAGLITEQDYEDKKAQILAQL